MVEVGRAVERGDRPEVPIVLSESGEDGEEDDDDDEGGDGEAAEDENALPTVEGTAEAPAVGESTWSECVRALEDEEESEKYDYVSELASSREEE